MARFNRRGRSGYSRNYAPQMRRPKRRAARRNRSFLKMKILGMPILAVAAGAFLFFTEKGKEIISGLTTKKTA